MNNSATIGGAVFTKNNIPSIVNNTLKDNKDNFNGIEIFTPPRYLYLLPESNKIEEY